MDVNGTRFYLVLGEADWRGALVEPVDPRLCWSSGRSVINLRPRPFTFPPRAGDERLTVAHRRGADRDGFGNWYWIDATASEIRFMPDRATESQLYWPPPEAPPQAKSDGAFVPLAPGLPQNLALRGLAVTDDQYLVVGASGLPSPKAAETTAGVLVFDLHSGGSPVPVAWPAELGFEPFDMAAVPGGGVAILDSATPGAPGPARYWMLDRYLRVCNLGGLSLDDPPEPLFAPSGSAPESHRLGSALPSVVAVSQEQAVSVWAAGSPPSPGARWATAIEVLPDQSVLILDREAEDGNLNVIRYVGGVAVESGFLLDAPPEGAESFPAGSLACSDQRSNAADIFEGSRGHDMAFVAGGESDDGIGVLFIVDEQGDQAFAFTVAESTASLEPAYFPLRLFGGKALVGGTGLAHYDLEERWFPVASRARSSYERQAIAVLAPDAGGIGRGFDGSEPETVWHRLFLDGSIAPGTSVAVECRAADDLSVLDRQPWQSQPDPYLRGAGGELPYHRYGSGSWEGTWELLFQGVVGRYMQLRLTLQGDGRRTPRIWAVRAHYPRFSYLDQYLPDVYREDAESASFLDRYLANVEGLYTTFEGRLAAAQWLLDARTTDSEYLEWLADWVGGVVDPTWDEARKRLFVRYAARMFTRRGTKRGLIEAIRLSTDDCVGDFIFANGDVAESPFGVRIVEQFRTREAAGVVFGDPTDLEGPRLAATGDLWTLEEGRSRLQERYEAFLSDRHSVLEGGTLGDALLAAWPGEDLDADSAVLFPPLTPHSPERRDDWVAFVKGNLEPAYATVGSGADLTAYRAFLDQRYRLIGDYITAWNLQGANRPPSFGAVEFPSALPADGAPLQDWIQFVSSVLPIQRNAHRFAVLVPIRIEESDAERQSKLGMVERVVAADRPGHTAFEVKPYWGAFRVGEARVGLETIVGEGSRYVEMVLGVNRLAFGFMPGGRTWGIDDRIVLDRDRIEFVGAATAASTGNGGIG